MARDKVRDEAWLREVLKTAGIQDTVYVTANHYDGGYELKVGTRGVFVEYEAIDAQETSWIEKVRT